MVHYYIELTQAFCEEHASYQVGPCLFGYGVTLDGRYVASVNALNEFPQIFEGVTLGAPIPLAQSDFPQPEEE